MMSLKMQQQAFIMRHADTTERVIDAMIIERQRQVQTEPRVSHRIKLWDQVTALSRLQQDIKQLTQNILPPTEHHRLLPGGKKQ